MTTETNSTVYDVLVASAQPGGRLTKISTAFPTAKGAGIRCTLKTALPEGAQLVFLPSRSKQHQPRVDYYSSAHGTIALIADGSGDD